jgi:hypothetical protein
MYRERLTVPDRSPFLTVTVPDRPPFLTVFDCFMSVPERLYAFTSVFYRFYLLFENQ